MIIKRNKPLYNLGAFLTNKFCNLVITNVKVDFPYHYQMVLKFTVNNKSKKSLTFNGDYREKYKLFKDLKDDVINNQEKFDLIKSNRKKWYTINDE